MRVSRLSSRFVDTVNPGKWPDRQGGFSSPDENRSGPGGDNTTSGSAAPVGFLPGPGNGLQEGSSRNSGAATRERSTRHAQRRRVPAAQAAAVAEARPAAGGGSRAVGRPDPPDVPGQLLRRSV